MLRRFHSVRLQYIVLQLPELRITLLLLCVVLLYRDVDYGTSGGAWWEEQ